MTVRIKTTAGVVTAAAVVMVFVFLTFATPVHDPAQEMGVGLAVAVLLDATVVRAVLLPATMKLLGPRNWYLPRWLGWLPGPSRPARPGLGRGSPSAAARLAHQGRCVMDTIQPRRRRRGARAVGAQHPAVAVRIVVSGLSTSTRGRRPAAPGGRPGPAGS